ncbi:MAG: hypothetical protein U0T83_05930 [Bacteriovoracaceae bacterium]
MIDNNVLENIKVYEVCGLKLSFKATSEENCVDPQLVIESFKNELDKQKQKFPHCTQEQLVLLTALSEIEKNLQQMSWKKSIKNEIDSLCLNTQSTIDLIEGLIPQ